MCIRDSRKPALPGPQETGVILRKRAWRVLWPWVVWSALFVLDRLGSAAISPQRSVGESFYPWMLASGTEMHLWFLPFIFVAEFAVLFTLWPARRLPRGVVIGAAATIAVAGVWLTGAAYDAYAPHYDALWKIDSDQAHAATWGWVVRKSWLFGLASVALGVVVGRTLACERSAWPRRALFAAACAALGLYFLWERYPHGPIHGQAVWQWWRQAGAFGLVALAVQFTGKTPAWLMRIAVLTMGIYLLHPWIDARINLVLSLLRGTTARDWLWRVDPVWHHYWGRLVIIWLLTAGLVALLRRVRWVRAVL